EFEGKLVLQEDVAEREVRMLHPVAAQRRRLRDHPSARLDIGPEQQPAVLDAAGADDEAAGADAPVRPGRVAHPRLDDAPVVDIEAGDIAVERDGDAL